MKYEREHETFDSFWKWLSSGGSLDFWACLGRPQGGATSGTARSGATLFVASDTQGVCLAAARALAAAPDGGERIACLDSPPMHLSRDTREKKRGTHDQAYFVGADDSAVELHPHQRVVLDWYLISRGQVITSVLRPPKSPSCSGTVKGTSRHPGESFYGWARALSGLGDEADSGARCLGKCGPGKGGPTAPG